MGGFGGRVPCLTIADSLISSYTPILGLFSDFCRSLFKSVTRRPSEPTIDLELLAFLLYLF